MHREQMMIQGTREIHEQGDEEKYNMFVEKFKPKKTTDDCYTPPLVYDAVAEWVEREYGRNREDFVRPFWPGADYRKMKYEYKCVVVDNPPFSIISQIVDFYTEKNIDFFIFGPSLTLFLGNRTGISYVVTDSQIIYENGARIKTGFITNMDKWKIRTAPGLKKAIEQAIEKEKGRKKELPQYEYPHNVITSAMMQKICHWGVDFRIDEDDCLFIRELDEQKRQGKGIFGGGFLLSDYAARDKQKAEEKALQNEKMGYNRKCRDIWRLSEREQRLIRILNGEESWPMQNWQDKQISIEELI